MTEDTPRRNSQVAAGKGKMQFVVTDAFREMLHDRAAALGTTMTDVMIDAVTRTIAADIAREAKRAERQAARGT